MADGFRYFGWVFADVTKRVPGLGTLTLVTYDPRHNAQMMWNGIKEKLNLESGESKYGLCHPIRRTYVGKRPNQFPKYEPNCLIVGRNHPKKKA